MTFPYDASTLLSKRALLTTMLSAICGTSVCDSVMAQASGMSYCATMGSAPVQVSRVPLADYWDKAVQAHFGRERELMTLYFGESGNIFVIRNYRQAFMNGRDNSISIGEGKIQDFGGQLLHLSGLLAHEQSHLFQSAWKLDQMLKDIRSHHVKYLELHADYMAGAYMAWSRNHRAVSGADAAVLFFELGDSMISSSEHHGTPQQRFGAFQRGFLDNELNVRGAAHRGLEYVRDTLRT